MIPTVSIVIVNWKTPDLLVACIESIKKNDAGHADFEFLIVDNNSQDGSVELLSKNFPDIFLLANDENLGFSIACNQVIPKAKGKYVLLLNPDTLVEDNAISRMAAFLDARKECGAVGPKVLNPDGTLQLACRRSFPSLESAFYRVTYLSHLFPNNKTFAKYNLTHADPDKELEVDALSGSCMMVRKEIIDRIGLLDEDIFMFGEDIDWCWRVKEDGYSVIYFPQSVVYHIHGASSRLRPIGATINLHKGMEVFYRKHYAKQYWAPINLLVYAAIWARAALFILVNLLKSVTDNKKKEAIDKQIAVSSPKEKEAEKAKEAEEAEKFETPVK
ncbi:glycosyltransferase family 2 protein [bacterium]|nr:glycosyltransferase family 2 protein [bacterium]QQR59364.1 MAG: glycosyltransferase family 2 protein [Candidatus Melainabacteria bacterium]